jgi:hypothetical protein
MPIVKTVKLNLPDGPFTLKIKCDAEGVFTADLPPGVARKLGSVSVYGDTLDLCRQAFDEALVQYRETLTFTRKVIVWDVEDSSRDPFGKGISLVVWAAVATEEKTQNADGFRFQYDLEKSTIPTELQRHGRLYEMTQPRKGVMDWTPEREEFFRKIGLAMLELTDSLKRLSDPVEAVRIADVGNLRLMAPSSETKKTRKA